ncbi:MAG: SGNH/GDSL hydrolase family protein [Chloroflexi bacterium]|nr:SGNH/GDSL hydrolase family protein [Chloroflexota bacterium]
MSLPAVHVVGDSISIHYGPYLPAMLAGVMVYSRKTAPDGSLDDAGAANGGDSSMVLAYVQSLQPEQSFDVLLLNCGLHDIKRDPVTSQPQITPDYYAANLRAILVESKRLAQRAIWVRTTPVIDERHNRLNTAFRRFEVDVEEYNAIADRIMREHNIPIIDLFSFTRKLGPDVYVDHVHFMAEVRAQQAAFIAGHLYQGAA